jgi:hypothetical protein
METFFHPPEGIAPMKRALLAAVMMALGGTVWAQDEVTYYDRTAKKDVPATGTVLEETAAGIKFKSGASTKLIPPGDVIEVKHEVKGVQRLTYRSYFTKERDMLRANQPARRKKLLDDALKGYRELLPKVASNRFAARHIQYKIASLLAREAEEDPEAVETAVAELKKFKDENPNSWQILRVAKLLADLYIRSNNLDAAEKTYSDLAQSGDLPKDVRQEFDLQSAQLLIETRHYDQAEQKLKSLNLPADDPMAGHVQVYLALCTGVRDKTKLKASVDQIEQTIDKTKDPNLKAVAYNALGDCYRLNGQLKDAVWEYLHVDMVYNQDKRQQTRAVEQLAKLFDELKDEKRAQEYRDRIKSGK